MSRKVEFERNSRSNHKHPKGAMTVTRPFFLVESWSQDAAANAGMLSVYLTAILYYHRQLFFDIEREDIR